MLTPLGVLRQPDIAPGRTPGPGQRVGILDKQVSGRPAVRSLIQVRLDAEMNLRAIKGDKAVPAAAPLADTETKPAVIGKGSAQVTNRENRRDTRTHHCNLSRPSPRRGAGQRMPWTGCQVHPLAGPLVLLADEPATTTLLPLRTLLTHHRRSLAGTGGHGAPVNSRRVAEDEYETAAHRFASVRIKSSGP